MIKHLTIDGQGYKVLDMKNEDIGKAFAEHHKAIERIVSSQVRGPREVIEDACQIAWTIAFRNAERLDSDTIRAYVAKIAIHEGWRLARKQTATAEEDTVLTGRSSAASVDDATERVAEQAEAAEIIARLSPQQRRVYVLKAVGYSYQEIAEILGISYTAVNHALTRGKLQAKGEKRRDR